MVNTTAGSRANYPVENTAARATEVEVTRLHKAPVTRQVAWGAIVGGVVITFITLIGLNMLGLAIGANTINPLYEVDPVEPGFNTAATIWIFGSTLLAAFVGGWVSARLAGTGDDINGVLHGIITWGLVAILLLFTLTSTVGGLISTLGNVVAQGASLVAQGAVEAVPEVADQISIQGTTLSTIRNELSGLITGSGSTSGEGQTGEGTSAAAPQTGDGTTDGNMNQFSTIEEMELNNNLYAFLRNPDATPEQRQEVVTAIAQTTGLSEQEASERLDRWQQAYTNVTTQVEETARQVGQTLTDTLAAMGGIIFGMLLAGSFAAGGGGYVAVQQQEEEIDTTVAVTR